MGWLDRGTINLGETELGHNISITLDDNNFDPDEDSEEDYAVNFWAYLVSVCPIGADEYVPLVNVLFVVPLEEIKKVWIKGYYDNFPTCPEMNEWIEKHYGKFK